MREDRLRALRAIRFAARYDFQIEPATRAAIAGSAPFLTRLSAERVQQELVKTMEQVERPAGALRLWQETGALAVLIPALAEVDDAALAALDALPRDRGGRMPQRTANRIAALFLDVPAAQGRRALTDLRLPKHQIAWVTALAAAWQSTGREMTAAIGASEPSDEQVRRWLSGLGRLHAGAFLRVASARWAAARAAGEPAPSAGAVRSLHRRMRRSMYRDAIQVADLRIGGDELRGLGIPAGPIYAKILQALLDFVLEHPARNTPEALLAEVPRIVAELDARAEPAPHPLTEP
jgi:tRNA nucleotidyltransferase (CCA-adding enzyme)